MTCSHCGASTVWDSSVASAVCTVCASLEHPSQVLLADSYAFQPDDSLWLPSTATTLKSFRAGSNWDLAGQGRESRDRRNAYAIAQFIKSLALALDAPGLSPRAITLFNQVRVADNFRWGQKSKRVAAACLSIALRESNRPDSLRDIASLLSVPPASVIREFTHITSTLGLSLSLVDPCVYISTLQSHVASALNSKAEDTGFPDGLTKHLKTLSLLPVANIATSLSNVLVRLSHEHDVWRLPVPPTACALFILALEAEGRAVLNPLSAIAQYLGSRCRISKSVVMTRYKILQDLIASWVAKVPWLAKYENKQGRAKVAKRLVVARGIKDLIQFQEEIWRQKNKPLVVLDLSDDEKALENSLPQSSDSPSRPTKRRKFNNAMSQAMQFLVDPLGTQVESVDKKRNSSTEPSIVRLATYILTNPSNLRPPTRLQLLALDHGGASEAQIPDDDLFAKGELEKLLRSEEEIQVLRETLGWTQSEQDCTEAEDKLINRKSRRNVKDAALDAEETILCGTAFSPKKKSRLNFDALAKFMAGNNDEVSEDGDFAATITGLEDSFNDYDGEEDEDGDSTIVDNAPLSLAEMSSIPRRERRSAISAIQAVGIDEEFVIEDWRPSSPERNISDSRYEEEHPP